MSVREGFPSVACISGFIGSDTFILIVDVFHIATISVRNVAGENSGDWCECLGDLAVRL